MIRLSSLPPACREVERKVDMIDISDDNQKQYSQEADHLEGWAMDWLKRNVRWFKEEPYEDVAEVIENVNRHGELRESLAQYAIKQMEKFNEEQGQ